MHLLGDEMIVLLKVKITSLNPLKGTVSFCLKIFFLFYFFLCSNSLNHILVDNIAKILPCDKTLSFV